MRHLRTEIRRPHPTCYLHNLLTKPSSKVLRRAARGREVRANRGTLVIDDNQIDVRPGNIGERLSGDAHSVVGRHRNGFDVIFAPRTGGSVALSLVYLRISIQSQPDMPM